MDFGDYLNMAVMLFVRDYYRDKEKMKRNHKRFYLKCYEEIVDYDADLYSVITNVSVKANPTYIPTDITAGAATLTIYAPFKVLCAQGGVPTNEQTHYFDMFLKHMTSSISKHYFLAATRGNSAAQNTINNLVGITDTFYGTFCVALSKALYAINSNEETLSRMMDIFSSIVMLFSILGRLKSEVAISICESFMRPIQRQIVERRKLPENSLDLIGKVSISEHTWRIENLSISLLYSAGD